VCAEASTVLRAVAADFFCICWCLHSKALSIIADAPWFMSNTVIRRDPQRDSDSVALQRTVHSCRPFQTELWSPLHGYVLKATFDNARQDGEYGAETENIPYSSPNAAGLAVSKELKEQSGYY
jgi:hypothetical protein